MDTAAIGMLVAVIGCMVGLAGWLSGRDKKISNDSEWKGQVNAKLDAAIGIKANVDSLCEKVEKHNVEISAIRQDNKSIHRRLDRLEEKNENIKGNYC